MTKLYSVSCKEGDVIVIVMTKLPPASKQTTSNCNRILELQFLAGVVFQLENSFKSVLEHTDTRVAFIITGTMCCPSCEQFRGHLAFLAPNYTTDAVLPLSLILPTRPLNQPTFNIKQAPENTNAVSTP